MGLDRRRLLTGGGAALGAMAAAQDGAKAAVSSPSWTHEADVVVVGAGASGMTAAIVAREAGASVIVLEAEPHVGGHAMVSGGNVALGGGTSQQKRYGVIDSADLLFQDLTDWALVEPNGFADYRYNDRELIRAYADHAAITFEWLKAHGVAFVEKAPDSLGGLSVGNSAPREHHAAIMDWPMAQTGHPAPMDLRATQSSGNGLMRPLEAAARQAGVQILLEHRMTDLHRAAPRTGRVTGAAASHRGQRIDIRARKAVMLATGGSTGNVNFRRMIDPRLTEEYCGQAGMPWSNQDASGEMAAMAVGASLWGMANQGSEFGWTITKPGQIGTQYGYANLTWAPTSAVFAKARATGLRVRDWQDVILVNMLGQRFYDETAGNYPSNDYATSKDHTPDSAKSAASITYAPYNYLNAALAGTGDGHNGGGPIWAIFDADAIAREGWTCAPPQVDIVEGFFFQADSLAELASKIVMRHQRLPMPPATLRATVARYNSFVDAGRDEDFGKPTPRYRIERGPFYAAWATPVIHDTRSGLRINAHGQVMDLSGKVIEGLYSGGETAGGFSAHGLARALCQGFIAGQHLANMA